MLRSGFGMCVQVYCTTPDPKMQFWQLLFAGLTNLFPEDKIKRKRSRGQNIFSELKTDTK